MFLRVSVNLSTEMTGSLSGGLYPQALTETPPMVKSGRYAPYWNVFLFSVKLCQSNCYWQFVLQCVFFFSWKMMIPFYTELPFERMREIRSDVKLVHGKIRKMIDYKNKIRTDKGKKIFFTRVCQEFCPQGWRCTPPQADTLPRQTHPPPKQTPP